MAVRSEVFRIRINLPGGEEPDQLIARTWVIISPTLANYPGKHKTLAEPLATEMAGHY